MEQSKYQKIGWWLSLLGLGGCLVIVSINSFPATGTWLVGWDNLLPELNLSLNIKRAFTAVWQGNQGLGHLGGHGHAATLWHSLTIWLMSLVLPEMVLRPVFVLFMLWLGVIGVWQLMRSRLCDKWGGWWAGLGAGLFYLFNYATVQQFYFELESFVIMYGLLPWALLSVIQVVERGKKQDWWWLVVIQLLFSSIGFIPPLFVVYCLILLMVWMMIWVNKRQLVVKKRMFGVGVVVLVVNMYWLLPAGYFTIINSGVYLESKSNIISTPGFREQGISRGGVEDVLTLKGYVWDVGESGTSGYALESWREHADMEWVRVASYLGFGVVLVGLVVGLKRRELVGMAMGAWVVLGMVALMQRVGGINQLAFGIQKIPVIGQAFRAAFTKISIPLAMGYAVLFGYGLWGIVNGLRKRVVGRVVGLLMAGLVVGGVVLIGWPMLKGELFYSRLKQTLPTEYLKLFEYMGQQNTNQRIAVFPLADNWGWSNYDWGYIGSGFLWYGLEQPVLDRAFDSWSAYNETYYKQVERAVFAGDRERLGKLFDKYDVSWILIDKHLLASNGEYDFEQVESLESMLVELRGVVKVRETGELKLYRVRDVDEVLAVNDYRNVNLDSKYVQRDWVFEDLGDYVDLGGWSYPYMDVLRDRKLEGVRYGDKVIEISREVELFSGEQVILPGVRDGERVEMRVEIKTVLNDLHVRLRPELPVVIVSGEEVRYEGWYEIVYKGVGWETRKVIVGDVVLDYEVGGEYQLLGRVGVSYGDSDFGIGLVGEKPVLNKEMGSVLENGKWIKCWNREGVEGNIEQKGLDNGAKLMVTDASACVSDRVGGLATKDREIVELRYLYQSADGATPRICLSREEDKKYQCYNQSISIVGSEEWQQISQDVMLNKSGEYWVDVIADSGEKGEMIEMAYRDLGVSVYRIVDWIGWGDSEWDGWNKPATYDVDVNVDEIVMRYPYDAKKGDLLNRLRTVRNCDTREEGDVEVGWVDNRMWLRATEGGVACDSVKLSSGGANVSYLLHAAGELEQGKGLDLLVKNDDLGRYATMALLRGITLDETHPILGEGGGVGEYWVDVSLWSYPNTQAEMKIEKLGLYEYPLSWVSRVGVGSKDRIFENDIQIVDIKKTGTWLYQVEVEGEGLISLSQGYDDGWVGIAMPNLQFTIYNLQNIEKLEHVKVNGWKNGWIVSDQEEQDVVIFYWPQLLQYLGFVMLGVGVIWLVRMRDE